LATVGRWAADPAGYDPSAALAAAVAQIAGPIAPTVWPLVRVSASWPPSAVRDAELDGLLGRLRSGDAAARARLDERFAELAALPVRLAPTGQEVPDALARGLRPWLKAARLAGRVGRAALRLPLDGRPGSARRVEALRRAWAEYQAQPKDILGPLLEPWVTALLAEPAG
jgi:hypothetical protein